MRDTTMASIDSHTARASQLGFRYQNQYALLVLLRAGHGKVSVERFDDIFFESPTGTSEVFQTKHSITPGSLANSSTDLWNTLGNWISALNSQQLDLKTTTLIIATTNSCSEDSAAFYLSPDRDKRDVERARTILVHTIQSSKSTDEKLAKHHQAFTILADRQLELLTRVYVITSSPNLIDLEDQIMRELPWATIPKQLRNLVSRLEEWWHRIVIDHLLGNSQSPITHKEVEDMVFELQRQYFPDNFTAH
jgi:hypothetical protein